MISKYGDERKYTDQLQPHILQLSPLNPIHPPPAPLSPPIEGGGCGGTEGGLGVGKGCCLITPNTADG